MWYVCDSVYMAYVACTCMVCVVYMLCMCGVCVVCVCGMCVVFEWHVCVWCVYALWCVCVCMRAKANALVDVEARVNARCLIYTPPFAPLEVGAHWSRYSSCLRPPSIEILDVHRQAQHVHQRQVLMLVHQTP